MQIIYFNNYFNYNINVIECAILIQKTNIISRN